MTDPDFEREALALFEALLDIAEADRDAWLQARVGERPTMLARISAMRAADRSARLRTGGADDTLEEIKPPEQIGDYRIVELIGRGGMGSVYRGERISGDFAHIVAIKVIKPGLLSEALVERFQRERQTLAGLVHPNIAQLYFGGETDEGSPWFAMELVHGLLLLQWIERNNPPVKVRRTLFAAICSAVAFAHSNLIIHRDLSPSNILVTADGQAKLIDFGIARPLDAAGAGKDASTGSLAGLSLTPGYAAPERMTSNLATTTTDIYSLGKLLASVIPGDGADRELAAIIDRATATDPAKRYPTVEALGADVAAWGSGHPVAAMGSPRYYAARKFIGRHKVGTAAAVLGVVLMAAAFSLTLIANMRAQQARADAERRFEQTRAIAKSLLFDVYDEVSRVPGSTVAREKLARTGLTYIEALAADPNAPPNVRVEAGRGYLRIAQVVGGGLSAQLGRYEDANALLARSEAILVPLVQADAYDSGARQALAELRVEQSAVELYNNNDVARARAHAVDAQKLAGPAPESDAEQARIFADAMRAEGDTYLWEEDHQRARDIFLAADRFVTGLPAAMQRAPTMQSVRAGILRYLGEAHHKLDETEPARGALDEAVALNQTVLQSQPNDPLFRRRVATSNRYRAIVHRANGRHELARQSIDRARTEAIWLRDRDPGDVSALQLLTVTGEVHMQTLADLGRYDAAYAVARETRAAYRRMLDLAGNAPGQRRSFAMALRSEGEIRYNGGDYAGACSVWAEILVMLEGLERRGALTDFDRNNGQAQTQDFMRRACNPPRAGLGPIAK